ncbi:hypothetical protein AWM75_08070 [Aerococcus urinaehominis]|uniref:Uncharacterized protein n=1 Tax=Aerococcus urinaehominis TaxID=128944 RepID=A0A0X8FMF1_9LACT|nr:hypothetical protein [Aerococcus urinaehominis]AMB99927.1 hypothetical protein AWM75_08070 [Aerococcus urinaehominis]SDM43146.1 peptide/nickel transport system permease protein/nickel transport system permease protein [Aerococcus urinaehominis]
MKWLIKHFIELIVTLLAASLIIFMLLRQIPGDPLVRLYSQSGGLAIDQVIQSQALQEHKDALGMNLPLITQYWHWLYDILHFDFG